MDTDSAEFQALLDQERKLLYVGLTTRARKLVYATFSGEGPNWIVERHSGRAKCHATYGARGNFPFAPVP